MGSTKPRRIRRHVVLAPEEAAPAVHDAAQPDAPIDSAVPIVHVWRGSLNHPAETVAELAHLLGPEELGEAARFVTPDLRARFITGRAMVRDVISRYSGVEAGALVIARTGRGQPRLADAARAPALRFSVSHSAGLAAIAISHGTDVGIDIEAFRLVADAAAVSATVFSTGVAERVAAMAEPGRSRLFLSLWVRREARLKARGLGVWDALGPHGDPGHAPDATLPLALGSAWVGALAIAAGTFPTIRAHRWNPDLAIDGPRNRRDTRVPSILTRPRNSGTRRFPCEARHHP